MSLCLREALNQGCLQRSEQILFDEERSHLAALQVTCLFLPDIDPDAGFHWCDFFVWSASAEHFLQRINYDATFMDKALLTAKAFYFHKFLSAVAWYFIAQPSSFGDTTGYQSNSTGDSSNSIGSGSNIIGHGSNTTGEGSNTTDEDSNTTDEGSNTTDEGNNTTDEGSNTTGHGSNTTGSRSNPTGHGTDLEKATDSCEDMELVAVFNKPSACW